MKTATKSYAVTDLNVSTPEAVVKVLRDTAEEYRYSAERLAESWQDPKAGSVWKRLAVKLERMAGAVERELAKGY